MQRFRNAVILLAALTGLIAVGIAFAWATHQHGWVGHAAHVLHLLIAFKVLKWIGAGVLLIVLALGRLVKVLRRRGAMPA